MAGVTNASQAALSNAFCRWAKDTLAAGLDPIVGTFPKNIFVFDFFHLLAGADGMLPLQLASGSTDSHPNAAATTLVAPQLVKQVFDAALAYESTTTATVPGVIPLTTPVNGARVSSDTVKCVWGASPSSWDWFEISTDSLFVSSTSVDSTVMSCTKVVRNLRNNTPYYWRVRGGNLAGWGPFGERRMFTVSYTAVRDQYGIPPTFALNQNYPNPFNPSTQIEFGIPKETRVKLEVYNVLGARVLTLEDRIMSAGYHSVTVQAGSLPSGLYVYRLTTRDISLTRKMLLMK